MKLRLLPLAITLSASISAYAQSTDVINKNLAASFNRIDYWSSNTVTDNYDSLGKANDHFEKSLLKYTASSPATISYHFKNLTDNGLNIKTAADGLFRIYSWDDESGGTMRFFRNVFQYKTGNTVKSKTYRKAPEQDEMEDNGCTYLGINEVNSGGKTYYVTQSVSIFSSANYSYTIKIFSIDNGQLNDKAKLIQTKSGLHNTLTYEVDWSEKSNRDSQLERDVTNPQYDAANNIIAIPLIAGDGKITDKKIRYKFNGEYFVKM